MGKSAVEVAGVLTRALIDEREANDSLDSLYLTVLNEFSQATDRELIKLKRFHDANKGLLSSVYYDFSHFIHNLENRALSVDKYPAWMRQVESIQASLEYIIGNLSSNMISKAIEDQSEEPVHRALTPQHVIRLLWIYKEFGILPQEFTIPEGDKLVTLDQLKVVELLTEAQAAVAFEYPLTTSTPSQDSK